MKGTGIFGGTFDPVHTGHLITALAVKEIRDLEKIIFMPAHISPHKMSEKRSAPEHRLEMVKLAIEGINYFECSDFEIRKEGVSYTIDTLRELKKQYEHIELIIGYDNLIVFDKWKKPEQIFELVKVVVLNRGSRKEAINKTYEKEAIFVDNPVIEISSTEIRHRVNQNLPIDFFVPVGVKEYIYNLNLYKE